MAIKLEKGQRINLEKESGAKLTNFCVGCNWGAIEVSKMKEIVVNEGFLGFGRKTEMRPVKEEIDVDIDSCLILMGNLLIHYILHYTKKSSSLLLACL